MKKKLLQFSALVLLLGTGLSSNAQTSWSITGNSNTAGTNFIGTKNLQPLIFKTNNVERMRLTKNGQLGFGITNPTYALQIQNPAFARGISVNNNFSGSDDRIGVYTSSVIGPGYGLGISASGGWYGTFSVAHAGNWGSGAYGVYAVADGTAGSRYGIFGDAFGGSFNAAGYFNGDVWADSYFNISDRKFKTAITQLTGSASLEQLLKLKPSAYEFDARAYPGMGLPKGKQMGLIADEVKQVFPELVKDAVHPAKYGKDKTEVLQPEEKYEGINYTGFIPVLIASIQEQQKTIDAVKAENQELKARLANIEQAFALNSKQLSAPVTSSVARLEQNAPNPFNRNTTINYYLPQKAGNAVMNITDMNGRLIKAVALTNEGKGQFVLEAGQLTPGTYQYSLIVNGKMADTKKMVLTK